jgi:predicted RNase H-like HicB family nuclease
MLNVGKDLDMKMKLTAVFEKVPEGYIAFVEELPGANTQADTIEEARTNVHKAVALVLEANRVLAEEGLNGRSVIRESFVIAYPPRSGTASQPKLQ